MGTPKVRPKVAQRPMMPTLPRDMGSAQKAPKVGGVQGPVLWFHSFRQWSYLHVAHGAGCTGGRVGRGGDEVVLQVGVGAVLWVGAERGADAVAAPQEAFHQKGGIKVGEHQQLVLQSKRSLFCSPHRCFFALV